MLMHIQWLYTCSGALYVNFEYAACQLPISCYCAETVRHLNSIQLIITLLIGFVVNLHIIQIFSLVTLTQERLNMLVSLA